MPGIWNNMCYVRYRMNEAKIWHIMDICNTSKYYMCSVLSRYVICYLYQLIHVVLCLFFCGFVLAAGGKSDGDLVPINYKQHGTKTVYKSVWLLGTRAAAHCKIIKIVTCDLATFIFFSKN